MLFKIECFLVLVRGDGLLNWNLTGKSIKMCEDFFYKSQTAFYGILKTLK